MTTLRWLPVRDREQDGYPADDSIRFDAEAGPWDFNTPSPYYLRINDLGEDVGWTWTLLDQGVVVSELDPAAAVPDAEQAMDLAEVGLDRYERKLMIQREVTRMPA